MNIQKIPRYLIDYLIEYKILYKKSKKIYSKIQKQIEIQMKNVDIYDIFNLQKSEYGYNIYVKIDEFFIFKNNRHDGIHTFEPVHREDIKLVSDIKLKHIIFLLFKDNQYYNTDYLIQYLLEKIKTYHKKTIDKDLLEDFYELFLTVKPKLKKLSDRIRSMFFDLLSLYNDIEMKDLNTSSTWDKFLNSENISNLKLNNLLNDLTNEIIEHDIKKLNI